MRISPAKDNVLVRKHICSQSDSYGQTHLIAVPDDFEKELKFCAEVLAIGPHTREGLRSGDFVILNPYHEYNWETNNPEDGELAIIREEDIYALLDAKPTYLAVVPAEARRFAEVA